MARHGNLESVCFHFHCDDLHYGPGFIKVWLVKSRDVEGEAVEAETRKFYRFRLEG